MRILKLCVALGLVGSICASASAIPLTNYSFPNQMRWNLIDFTEGDLYQPAALGTSYVEQGAANVDTRVAIPGSNKFGPTEDFWGIALCNSITDAATDTIEHWVSDTDGDGFSDRELTILFFGGQDVVLSVSTDGLGNTSQTVWSSGLKVVVYEHLTADFNAGNGLEGRTAPDVYDTVTNGTLILELQGVAVIPTGSGVVPYAEFTNTLSTSSFIGAGFAYLEVADIDGDGYAGRDAGQFNTNCITTDKFGNPFVNNLTPDFEINFNVTGPHTTPDAGRTAFDTRSQDPVITCAIPEPATSLAVIFGVGGLVGYIRRRRS